MSRPRAMAAFAAIGALALGAGTVLADQSGASPPTMKVDTGDTAWMLVSTALVLMMTVPGLALFYGGLVRTKNILSTLMHSLFCAGLISVTWVVFGYSLAFGPDKWGLIGGLDFVGLAGILGTNSSVAPTIPHIVFVAYQATFAIITPALISGAFAERMRFPAFALFMLLWSVFIYAPVAHWIWGGGWIATQVGAIDFAGGTVVHIACGISALVTALYLGKRLGHGQEPMPPHNLPFTVIGASLLWVGWFGFNAGSAGKASELAGIAFVNTNTAAGAAALAWMLIEWFRTGKPTVLGMASGAVAGLATVTQAAGYVTPMASVLIGLAGGAACYYAVSLKPKFGYDDALDVVGVHMVAGTLGAVLTGVFATMVINADLPILTHGLSGGLLYDGGTSLLVKQLIAAGATYAYCGVGTLVLLVVVNAITRVRTSQDEEIPGLDLSQHSERAYATGGGEAMSYIRLAEPRPASMPPVTGGRFSVIVDGIDEQSLLEYWRSLCKVNGQASAAFKEIYWHVTTIRGNSFRFRGGNREQIRQTLEDLFRETFPKARARIAKEENAPVLV